MAPPTSARERERDGMDEARVDGSASRLLSRWDLYARFLGFRVRCVCVVILAGWGLGFGGSGVGGMSVRAPNLRPARTCGWWELRLLLPPRDRMCLCVSVRLGPNGGWDFFQLMMMNPVPVVVDRWILGVHLLGGVTDTILDRQRIFLGWVDNDTYSSIPRSQTAGY